MCSFDDLDAKKKIDRLKVGRQYRLENVSIDINPSISTMAKYQVLMDDESKVKKLKPTKQVAHQFVPICEIPELLGNLDW